MNTMLDVLQHPAVTALAWTLIHFLWQGVLLGAVACAALRVLRPKRATTRYAIAVATLAAMVVTCALTFTTVARQQPAQADVALVAAPSIGAPVRATPPAAQQLKHDEQALSAAVVPASPLSWRIESIDARLLTAIVIVWLIGVAAMSVRLAGGWMLTRRLATRAAVAVSPAIDLAARSIARRLKVRRTVAILESQLVAVPTLIGWLKPVVLLPTAALAGLSPDQLRAILAHELAHVRRHDYVVNLLQSSVETLLFYHPAVWWVSAQIRAEREHCCDDLAIDVCGDRLVYASALAELTALSGTQGLALAATDGSLVNRVRRILSGERSTHEPAPLWPLFALVVLVTGAASFSADAANQSTSAPTQPLATAAAPVVEVFDASTPATPASTPTAITAPATPSSPTTIDQQSAAVVLAQSDALRAEAMQTADIAAQLREQAAVLAAEAARLRAEADRIRQEEIEMNGWRARMFDVAPPPPPPPASPAPDAPRPPAPPPSESAREQSSERRRDSGNMVWSNNGESVSLKWTGAFRLSDDESDIEWVENGATVTVGEGGRFASQSQVELRGTPAGIERRFTRNGERREFEPEGRAFLKAVIDRLVRSSGAFAKERVARFLRKGGPDAVLAEINRLDESSHVRRVYYSELLKQAPMSDALLGRVLQRVPAEVRSDHDKATLLIVAAALPALNDSHRMTIARAVSSINSDHDQRRTLTAIMNTKPLAAALSAAILEATATIKSSHDRSEVLLDVIERGGLTDTAAPAFFDAAAQIPSSHDLSKVLRKAVAGYGRSDRVIEGVIAAAPKVTSSHDRANVLIDVAARVPLTGALRQRYIAATSGLGNHDETRVLAALVRAEGRQ